MKTNLSGSSPCTAIRRLAAGLILVFLFLGAAVPALAQERWLLVFDTSAMMKKRLPAVEAELEQLFASDIGGNLHLGDSVGVWTFDSKVHTGQFPLLTWDPENGLDVVTNLMKFLHQQEFAGETDFGALQPLVGRVIQHSERLTILIFCDGDGQIHWTPYDDGINGSLQQSVVERKKTRQPVVMIVRTQQGKFVGASVTYPPALPNRLPEFPPLPVVVAPGALAPAPVAPPPPVVSPPPLIIVGTSVGTDTNAVARFDATNIPARMNAPDDNLPETSAVTLPPPPVTNVVQVILQTNLVTNLVTVVSTTSATQTNSAAGTVDEGSDRGTKILLSVGAVLFGTAVVLVIVLLVRKRRPASSLITSLMSDDPRFRK